MQETITAGPHVCSEGGCQNKHLSKGFVWANILSASAGSQLQLAGLWDDGIPSRQWEGKVGEGRFRRGWGWPKLRGPHREEEVGLGARVQGDGHHRHLSPTSSLRSRCRSLQLLPQPPGAHGVGREPELPPAAGGGQQPHVARWPEPAARWSPHRQAPAAAGHRGLAGTPEPLCIPLDPQTLPHGCQGDCSCSCPHPTNSLQEHLTFPCRVRPADPILLEAFTIFGHLMIEICINMI